MRSSLVGKFVWIGIESEGCVVVVGLCEFVGEGISGGSVDEVEPVGGGGGSGGGGGGGGADVSEESLLEFGAGAGFRGRGNMREEAARSSG